MANIPPAIGNRVVIDGLQKFPEFNRQKAEVVSVNDNEDNRIGVRLIHPQVSRKSAIVSRTRK